MKITRDHIVVSGFFMILTEMTYVKFAPLFIRQEGKEYLIGHAEKGTTFLFSSTGHQAIKLLQNKSIKETQKRLERKEKNFDVPAFVKSLKEEGLVEEVGQEPFSNPKLQYFVRKTRRLWLLAGLALVALIFGIIAGSLLLTHPQYRPTAADFFWSEQNFKNLLSLIVASFVLLWSHEAAHAFAGWWGGGIKAHFSYSYRFIFLVAQTRFPLAWKLPRLERSAIYLAGMGWDVFWISSLIITYHFLQGGETFVPLRFLRQLILIGAFSLGWQFFFIFRNDLYFLFSDLIRRFNLHAEALAYLGSLVRLKPLPADRITKAYAWVMVGVSILVLRLYGLIPLNILWRVIQTAAASLRSYPSAEFIDSLLVSLFLSINLSIYAYLVGRDIWARLRAK